MEPKERNYAGLRKEWIQALTSYQHSILPLLDAHLIPSLNPISSTARLLLMSTEVTNRGEAAV